MRKSILFLVIVLSLSSCSTKKIETDLINQIVILQKQVKELEVQLDECENGAEKMLANINISFEEGNYANVKYIYSNFQVRHPESPEFIEAQAIYDKVIKIEEKEKKEAERIAEQKKAEKEQALNKLNKEYDDVSGTTWYRQPYYTHYPNSNLISIYFGKKTGSPWLRLKMSYYGDDWIFFEHAYISYDGNTKEIYFDEYDEKETEVGSGGNVYEWIDVSVDEETRTFLIDFANSPNAKMRLTGKYTSNRNLSYNERQGIIDVLNGYDVIKH